jgi:hypothetical protein
MEIYKLSHRPMKEEVRTNPFQKIHCESIAEEYFNILLGFSHKEIQQQGRNSLVIDLHLGLRGQKPQERSEKLQEKVFDSILLLLSEMA